MDRDRGSVTVLAASALAVIWTVAMVVLGYGAALVARHRVETAADLGALAAAAHVPDGSAAACTLGATVANRNGGTVTACRVVDADVEIVVSRTVRIGRFGVHTVTGRARAGPVDQGEGLP